MNLPIDTCENGSLSFAINCVDGCARTLTQHYHKEGWGNFLGTGSSKMLATAVIVILEV